MTSWLFDPRPAVEWRGHEGLPPGKPEAPQHLFSSPIPQPSHSRFPRDPTLDYRMFRDHWGRESKSAFLHFGPKPKTASLLVDQCWINGVPLFLRFDEPPSWETPYWRDTLNARSIQTAEAGRLRWQPIVSWEVGRLEGAIEELSEWLTRGLPFFPAPILRLEFSEAVPFEGIGEAILELAAHPLPCRFKLFSLADIHLNRIPANEWAEILKGFQDAPPNEKVHSQVIPLYPER